MRLFVPANVAASMTCCGPVGGQELPAAFTPAPAGVNVLDLAGAEVRPRPVPPANPFTEVSVRGEFGPEGGETIFVDGFCDASDGSVHRVRFMPSRPGRHAYAFDVPLRGGGGLLPRHLSGAAVLSRPGRHAYAFDVPLRGGGGLLPRHLSGAAVPAPRSGQGGSAPSVALRGGRRRRALLLEFHHHIRIDGMGRGDDTPRTGPPARPPDQQDTRRPRVAGQERAGLVRKRIPHGQVQVRAQSMGGGAPRRRGEPPLRRDPLQRPLLAEVGPNDEIRQGEGHRRLGHLLRGRPQARDRSLRQGGHGRPRRAAILPVRGRPPVGVPEPHVGRRERIPALSQRCPG